VLALASSALLVGVSTAHAPLRGHWLARGAPASYGGVARAPAAPLSRAARGGALVVCSVAAEGASSELANERKMIPPARASSRALEIEDRMLVLSARRDLAQGEFAAELGSEWLHDMSMVSDIDFGGLARRMRRDQATLRTRLAPRGALPQPMLDDLTRRQADAISELERLAETYEQFAAREALDEAAGQAVAVRQKFAQARRTIAKLNQRRQQLQTTIEAPAARPDAPAAVADGGGEEEGALPSLSEAVESATQLWSRINPSGRATPAAAQQRRAALDEEARALRLSRTEIEKAAVGLEQLRLGQEARSAALSEDSRVFVGDQMELLRGGVAKMQTELVLKLLGVNLQRAHAFLDDELREAVQAPDSQAHEQLISYAKSFITLDRRFEGARRASERGVLGGTDGAMLELERDVQDFLLVLGLTTPTVDAVAWDLPRTQGALRSNVDKLGTGVQFYIRGVRLLGQDAAFSLGLLSQAAGGQTLTEREARILQRTARDLLTFIPFVIILIIPLSPPGHVLVFSLIQRIFPDFFPSAFSEKRQNLIDTYDRIASASARRLAAPGEEEAGEGKEEGGPEGAADGGEVVDVLASRDNVPR
jgi:hypothetical protein